MSTNYAAVLVESAVTSTASFGIMPNNLSESEKYEFVTILTLSYAPTSANLNS